VSSGPVVINQKAGGSLSVEDNYGGILWRMSCQLEAEDIRRANPVEEIMSILGAQTLMRPNKDVIGLVLTEMYSNALEHGILDLASELKKTEEGFVEYYQQRQDRLENLDNALIQINFKLIKDDELILRIRLSDSGSGFDVKQLTGSSNEDSFGRGIGLINRVCNRVEYLDGGSTIEVDFPVSKMMTID
jgi:two-component sensor histidine kinase